MKHKLYHSDVLREEGEDIKSLIHIYDNSVKTGSEVLDVILMDYGLRYGGENITFTFMGNGACLDFMKESDLYSLFGNALSNAAEAVMRLSDGEKKTVSVTVNQKGDFVTVNVNNYYAGELSFHGELPQTSKANKDQSHGFGVKSMQLLAKKYGGELRIAAEGGIFRLNIYFMRPKSAER
jgi:sensor histidine kinase regulating citrate/malate metabolism